MLSHEEILEQRNKLLTACEKVLTAYDAARDDGERWGWHGQDVDDMRGAVADARGHAESLRRLQAQAEEKAQTSFDAAEPVPLSKTRS